jgi:hypothetical protein
MSNSSGSVERFLLGLNEAKTYETLAPGDNSWVVDVHNPIGQNIDGSMFGANAVVALQTAELVAAAAATKTFGVTNTITLTAVNAGVSGNAIEAEFVNPGVSASLAVSVTGSLIVVNLATDAGGVVTSTPAQVATAINTTAAAAQLVNATSAGVAAMVAIAQAALTGGADAGPGTFTTVGSAVTVVPEGKAALVGNTGRYARLVNTGSGLASVVAKPLHRVQPLISL